MSDRDTTIGVSGINSVDTWRGGDRFNDLVETGGAIDVGGDVGEHESGSFSVIAIEFREWDCHREFLIEIDLLLLHDTSYYIPAQTDISLRNS